MSVEATLKDIVIRIVHCDEDVLTPAATWKDVKADSLDMVQILVAVEDTFNIEVPDEEAKKYFQEHEDELIQPERVHLSVIELGPDKEKEINALYRQIRAGKDFADLAKANSKNVSAGRGGDLGFMTRKQYKHLTDVAFTLKPGNTSKPFKSPAGWTIIRVHEIIKKQEVPLEEGIKRAKSRIEGVETANAFNALMKNVREKYGVVLYEDKIRQLQPGAPPKEAPGQKGS